MTVDAKLLVRETEKFLGIEPKLPQPPPFVPRVNQRRITSPRWTLAATAACIGSACTSGVILALRGWIVG